jgi:hypothetical protein
MKFRLLIPMMTLVTASLLVSCGGMPLNTKPTAAELDRYWKKAEERAQQQIAVLDTMKAQGKLSQEQYDLRVLSIQNNIGKNANEIAWTRHELAESQRRALGIPTGDHVVEVSVPQPSGTESFYRPYGQVGSGFGNTSASGSPGGGMWRGYTPGTMASQAGSR